MRILLNRLCLAIWLCCLTFTSVTAAFDVVSGGGKVLLTQTNVDDASRVLVNDLLLTTNTSVATETVTLTLPAGTGTLEFSNTPLAIIADSGNFTVTTPVITANDITFDITGAGTLRVQNIGLFNTNPAAFAEDRRLNVNFQGSDTLSDFFRVHTGDIAVAFGGGKQLNGAHTSAASALLVDDLVIESNVVLANETFTITPDSGLGFATVASGSIDLASGGNTLAGTTMDSLNNFADGDTITVTDNDGNESLFAVTAVNTVTDFETFLTGITNLTATFDDPNDEIDLIAAEDFLITSDGAMPTTALDADPAANLQFNTALPNFLVTSGNLTFNNLTLTGDQLQFDLSGTGRLEIQGLSLFADNLDEKGEFFELRFLNVNAQATDIPADLLVVDTTDYGTKTNASGATGGDSNNIFIVGDTLNLTFAPFDFSSRLSAVTLDLSTFGGDALADFNDPFVLISDDDDGDFTPLITVSYNGTNVQADYFSQPISIDNQPPVFDFTGHNILEIPAGKTVAGINDLVVLRMPPESSGDDIVFTADLSSVAGSIANFVDVPAVDTTIALEEVAIDDPIFSVPITFADNAGNVLPTLNTNQISVDLIRPVLATANILSIVGGPIPGTIGDVIQVDLPVDTVGSPGDAITYNLDLSALGGNEANLVLVSAATNVVIKAGALNDAAFNQTLTVFDKAGNSVAALTNSLQIDNAVPTFNTACGATFQVVDQGDLDTNGIADITNGTADRVFFLRPDKNIVGCDLDAFEIDLTGLGSQAAVLSGRQDANGTGLFFTLEAGSLDLTSAQFPLTVFDINGNETNFLTGPLNVDQNLAVVSQIKDDSFITSGKGPNGVVLVGGEITVQTIITEADIVAVTAEIDGAAQPVNLNRLSDGRWFGSLLIDPGFLTFEPRFIRYTLTDDAGNVVVLEGDKVFYITNNTTIRRGGGGGSLSTSTIQKKSTLQRFTPNQTKEFHNLNTAQKVKSKEELRIDSLRRRMSFPPSNVSRIIPRPLALIEQQRAAWKARQAAIKKDGTPKKLQKGLEKIIFARESAKDLAAARPETGDFRLRSTLDNLKGANQSNLGRYQGGRSIAPHHRGKWLEVKR